MSVAFNYSDIIPQQPGMPRAKNNLAEEEVRTIEKWGDYLNDLKNTVSKDMRTGTKRNWVICKRRQPSSAAKAD